MQIIIIIVKVTIFKAYFWGLFRTSLDRRILNRAVDSNILKFEIFEKSVSKVIFEIFEYFAVI